MRLFVCYAHVDKWQVTQLIEILRDGGHSPWFDQRLLPGQDWKAILEQEIVNSDAFMYAMSPESVSSEWCQWEFSRAIERGRPIIPVLLRTNTELPSVLKSIQYADFTDGPTSRGIAKLMGGLLNIAVRVPVTSAAPAPANPSGIPAQAL